MNDWFLKTCLLHLLGSTWAPRSQCSRTPHARSLPVLAVFLLLLFDVIGLDLKNKNPIKIFLCFKPLGNNKQKKTLMIISMPFASFLQATKSVQKPTRRVKVGKKRRTFFSKSKNVWPLDNWWLVVSKIKDRMSKQFYYYY